PAADGARGHARRHPPGKETNTKVNIEKMLGTLRERHIEGPLRGRRCDPASRGPQGGLREGPDPVHKVRYAEGRPTSARGGQPEGASPGVAAGRQSGARWHRDVGPRMRSPGPWCGDPSLLVDAYANG